jgi:hypothetical protein
MLALNSVTVLEEQHKSYEKGFSAKIKLFSHWIALSEEERAAALGKDLAEFVAGIAKLGCPSSASDLKALVTAFAAQNKDSITHVHEAIKVRSKILKESANIEAEALAALNADPRRNFLLCKVINLHKRILKSGSSGAEFRAKAQDLFSHAKYFTQ